MDYTLLRSWLGLPPGPWPPDHYTLLGLPPGVGDPAAVESRVMERMDLLRRNQLLHPELVTEGMNRLAQALITLTDPVGKAAYDAEIGIPVAAPPKPAIPPPVEQLPPPTAGPSGSVVIASPVFDDDVFSDDPLPVEPPDRGDVTQVIVLPGAAGPALPYAVIGGTEPPPAPPLSLDQEPIRPAPEPEVIEAEVLPRAPVSGTVPPAGRRWIYARLALLRRAIRAWDRLRPVLGDPQDPVDRPGRVLLLLEGVWAVRPLLPQLRGVVGGVGEPGGVVAVIVGHPLVLDTFRRLLPDQRQTLAIDWRRGQEELQREHARLRRLARAGRERPVGARGGPALWRRLKETPEVVLAALAAAAMLIALFRTITGL